MSMENLKVLPEDTAASHYDSTFELDGREELIETIKDKYPDEYQKSEEEIENERLQEAVWNPESPENQNLNQSGADAFSGETELPEGVGASEEDQELLLDESNFENNPFKPQAAVNLTEIPPDQREYFNLDIPIHEREAELGQMLKNPNLEDTLSAFRQINADPTLTSIFDWNGDGRFTLADLLDLSRMNDGKGVTAAQDKEMTDRWLSQLEGKDLAARMKALWGMLPASTRTAHLIDGRQSRLDPRNNAIYSQNFDNNLRAGILESLITTLNLPEQAAHFVTGGRLGGGDKERFGDWLSGRYNENSMMSMMMNPHKSHWADGLGHEIGYWGTEGIMAYATLGVGLQGTAVKSSIKHLPKGKRLALAATKFLKPTAPSTLGATSALGKLGNLAFTTTKTGFIETFKGAMQRDLTYAAQVGLYNESKFAKKIIDLHPDSWIFGAQLQWAIESPLGKRFAYWVDEGTQDSVFGGAMFGLFNPGRSLRFLGSEVPKLPGEAWRFGPKTLGRMRTSFARYEWSANPLSQRNGRHFWNIRQRKQLDIAEAGEVQLELNLDPSNPFTRDNALGVDDTSPASLHNARGSFKNGSDNPIDGVAPTRSNVTQVLADTNEMDASHLTRRGSTDAVMTPTELSIAARHGVNGPILERLTKEFVEDGTYAEQLKSLDATSRTAGDWGEGTFKRMSEIEGRDAASLDPREYWGDALMDQPLVAGSVEDLSKLQRFVAENLFVADSINSSLLSQLRDISAATSEALGKQDVFAADGGMKRVADNLAAGLSNVKKSRLTWSVLSDKLKSGEEFSEALVDEVNSIVAARGTSLHDETVDGVRLMMQMLKDSDSEELVDGLLDVFKVSNHIHNWKDFDAWMRQKISGGEFRGKVKTGALIHELQGVMVNSILSGPKTPLRAILGTTTNAYLNAINEYAGAVIRSPFIDNAIDRKASLAKLKGMFELLPEAWQVFRENWNAKFTADFANIRTRYSEAPTRGDYNWKLFGEWTELRGTDGDKAAYYLTNNARKLNDWKLASWSPRALAATDDTYKWLMARVRSKEIGMRQALDEVGEDWTKLTPELMKRGEDLHYKNLLDAEGNLDFSKDAWLNKQFKEVTLTSELKGFSAKLDGLLNETPLLKPFYLFARTGINGLNLSFKNTPLLGAMHKESIAILRHQGDDFTPLMKYGIENANDLANARNLFAGRQAVGATVVTGISGMYIGGQLTGNGPADRQLKQQWVNAGWKPNHIYIGDVGFNYSSLEPFNVIFSAIADIGDNMELMGTEWAEKRLQAVGYVLGRGLTSKTYMSGLDQLMQVVQMKPGAMNKTAANILNNSIPLAGLRNEFGKWINPHMKELNSSMWDSIRNRNQMSELVAQNPLPVKHDMLNGTPINNWNIIGRSFNALSPISLDIRKNTPGRRLLLDSGYDLKTTTYSYGGYSFQQHPHVRSHFQNAIGSVPIEFRNRKFKNVEEALNYIATLPDVKSSMSEMNANRNNPAKWDVDPNDYPHNTLINLIMDQARSKAWAVINQPNHPGYSDVQKVKGEKDGLASRTRDTRREILELNYPTYNPETFPQRSN